MNNPTNRLQFVGSAFLAALVSLALLLQTSSTEAAQRKTSKDVVKIDTKAEKPDDKGVQVVTVTLKVDEGWHVYANPVGNNMLENVETKVTIAGDSKHKITKVDYPPGKTKKDVLGPYKVYEDTVDIKVHLQREGADAGPVNLKVLIQACNENACLLPGEVKVTVP
jgi:DsbC/DsbD-like thiol-disulfide interchange protein